MTDTNAQLSIHDTVALAYSNSSVHTQNCSLLVLQSCIMIASASRELIADEIDQARNFNGYGTQLTANTAWAKSPSFPVTCITYSPGSTFPSIKPPLGIPVPAWITHADDRITPLDEGLDTEQVVSTGRKPWPINEILEPDPLKEIVGVDSTRMNVALAAIIRNVQISIVVKIRMDD